MDSDVVKNKIIICHCGNHANKYRERRFKSIAGYEIIRTFFRCTGCASRIYRDECPEMDAMKQVSVSELLKQHRHL